MIILIRFDSNNFLFVFFILIFISLTDSSKFFSRYDRPIEVELFKEKVSQGSTSTASTPPKCHCWTAKAETCVPYDSRLQAASLEEAIIAFPDLTITRRDGQAAPSKPTSLTALAGPAACKNQQCRNCYKELRSQLRKVGLLPSTIDDVFNKQTNLTCSKYRFSRKDEGVYETSKNSKHYDWNFMDYSEIDYSDYFDSDYSQQFRKKIDKRSSDSMLTTDAESSSHHDVNTSGIIGVRYPISCTTRGITPDGLNTVSLCSTCWVWRRLPSSYYPAYVNEVVCDSLDTTCLSGYASCQTGTQQLNVLRNDSGTLVPVSVSAGINCECRIKVGSALESLVLGNGLNSSMPAINATTLQKSINSTGK